MLQQYHTVSRSITQCPFRSRQARGAEIGSIVYNDDNNENGEETLTDIELDAGITPAAPADDDVGGDDISTTFLKVRYV